MKRALVVIVSSLVLVWLGFTAYNLLVLNLPFRDSFLLPLAQILWSLGALIGMVLFKWPARIIALGVLTFVIVAILCLRAGRKSKQTVNS